RTANWYRTLVGRQRRDKNPTVFRGGCAPIAVMFAPYLHKVLLAIELSVRHLPRTLAALLPYYRRSYLVSALCPRRRHTFYTDSNSKKTPPWTYGLFDTS